MERNILLVAFLKRFVSLIQLFFSFAFFWYDIYCWITSIDLASGSSIDWAYANQNVSMAYSFEFRDSRTGN